MPVVDANNRIRVHFTQMASAVMQTADKFAMGLFHINCI